MRRWSDQRETRDSFCRALSRMGHALAKRKTAAAAMSAREPRHPPDLVMSSERIRDAIGAVSQANKVKGVRMVVAPLPAARSRFCLNHTGTWAEGFLPRRSSAMIEALRTRGPPHHLSRYVAPRRSERLFDGRACCEPTLAPAFGLPR